MYNKSIRWLICTSCRGFKPFGIAPLGTNYDVPVLISNKAASRGTHVLKVDFRTLLRWQQDYRRAEISAASVDAANTAILKSVGFAGPVRAPMSENHRELFQRLTETALNNWGAASVGLFYFQVHQPFRLWHYRSLTGRRGI